MKKLWVSVIVSGICLCSCPTAKGSDPAECSAFSRQGDAATARFVKTDINIQISLAGDSKPLAFSTVVNDDGLVSCSIFFDSENHYVAVGLNDLRLKPGPLFVVVADLRAKQLVSNFSVQPNAGMGAALKLVGFSRSSPNLVVFGTEPPNVSARAFAITVFRFTGERASPTEERMLTEDTKTVGNVGFVDTAHNRLWFPTDFSSCPLRSVPLLGKETDSPRVDESTAQAACDVGSAIAYPDENTLITAATREPRDLVTRMDLAQHSAQEITLPSTGGYGNYTAVRRGVLSPDGRVFAVSRSLLSNSFSGDAHNHGTEIDVVQVSPLEIIGKVRLRPDANSTSISIDHRNGVVTVLYFEGVEWKSEHLKAQ